MVPRSPEEKQLYWPDSLIYPLRATIDDFIFQNKENIDITRIYIGGSSMGGRMTYKMIVAYPEMFAAAFPVCPSWSPTNAAAEILACTPIWLTSGKLDPLVTYSTFVSIAWKKIIKNADNPENFRFSTLTKTAYADGTLTSNQHYSWYAVNNDMFSAENGNYPFMSTVDGNGNEIELTYPDGMISWLSSFSSNFDGSTATDSGNERAKGEGNPISLISIIFPLIRNIIVKLKNLFRNF